jgi:hypothetical protein
MSLKLMNAASKATSTCSRNSYYYTTFCGDCQGRTHYRADCFNGRQSAFYFIRDVMRSRITQNNSGLVILADAIKEVAGI